MAEIDRIGRTTLQDSVYARLKSALMAGDYAPGQAVTVREIAEEVGTSPMPVREAIRRLTAEGALEILGNGTARVSAMTKEQRLQVLEIRVALEGMAVERAVAKVTGPALQELSALNERYRQFVASGQIERASVANREFHFTLYRLSGADVWLKMIEDLWTRVGPYVAGYTRSLSVARPLRSTDHHALIIRALRRGDGVAAAVALRADIGQALAFMSSDLAIENATRARARGALARAG